jgi:hypothetical protein
MENIAFECMACNGDFEVNITHFLERPNSLKCPHCGARPSSNRCHALAQALDDLFGAMAAVRNKVHFELNVDNDALPAPYGGADDGDVGLGNLDEEEEGEGTDDEDEDDDDEDEDDDDAFDDDDDAFDDEDDLDEDDEDDEDGDADGDSEDDRY